MNRRLFISLIVAVISLWGLALPIMAQQSTVAEGEAAIAPARGPTDVAELESFLDQLILQQLTDYHLAGATVAVVRDGKVLLTKGYGFADIDAGTFVDPEQTVFLIGSVGKLFTWTSVMQLVEQGKLDLDADINTYLDFRIPDTYPQPITLRDLLTHTAGFEDLYFEYLALDPAELMPERDWLMTHIPARVRPPGEAASYSNYGTQLAGYIVAQVSGQPYEQYVQEHILDPLGMAHSTAQSPAPADLQLAVGYMTADGEFQKVPTFYGQSAMFPAGAHGSTAADMARFMLALLNNEDASVGDSTQGHILSAATVARMQQTLYAPDSRLRGTAYGLFDLSENGVRTLGHDGDTLGFKTLMLLMPDERLGVFLSYNGEEADALTRQHFGFQRAFFDHYYPASAIEPVQPAADFAAHANRFTGSYRMARRAHSSMEKYRSLNPEVVVSAPGDGTINIGTPWGDWRYVEVEPLYFRQVDGPSALIFREDSRGRITHLFMDLVPQFAFEKVRWYEMPGFNTGLMLACIFVFLSAIPVLAIRAVRNRRWDDNAGTQARKPRLATFTILLVCILNLLFIGGMVLWGEANLTPLFGVTPIFRAVLVLGVVSAALTVVALGFAVVAWKDRYWGVPGRAYYTLLTVTAVAFVWFLNFWNLLGWRF